MACKIKMNLPKQEDGLVGRGRGVGGCCILGSAALGPWVSGEYTEGSPVGPRR